MNNYELRLYEIKYFNLINKFFRNTKDNTKLYDFLELISVMFDCNYLQLKVITTNVIMNDYSTRPSVGAHAILLVKTGKSIRSTCKELNISTSTYYRALNRYKDGNLDISPKYPLTQTTEVIKAVDGLTKLTKALL